MTYELLFYADVNLLEQNLHTVKIRTQTLLGDTKEVHL